MSKPRRLISAAVAALTVIAFHNSLHAQTREINTVNNAAAVMDEVMRTPGKKIPQGLLSKADAVVIIPNMIKGGFVIGARHGHGVALIRNAAGGWDAPRFVQMTGGSVGFQAGVQSTDVVLLFMTRKSVQGLLSGKFTIGADAAAAAGPVGRQLAAATDERLSAEILSYARSRGLFAGVSLDGSAIRIDPRADGMYYRAGPDGKPAPLPPSAVALINKVNEYSGALAAANPAPAGTPIPARNPGPNFPQPGNTLPAPIPIPARNPRNIKRQELVAAEVKLSRILPGDWQAYLAFPAEVFTQGAHPPVQRLEVLLARFDKIAKNPQYRALAEKSEFQQTHRLLREYIATFATQPAPTEKLQLPPAPAD